MEEGGRVVTKNCWVTRRFDWFLIDVKMMVKMEGRLWE